MLFHSIEFILFFMPLCLMGYYFVRYISHQLSLLVLVIASLLFYAYWNIYYVPLILFSVLFNYLFGLSILSCKSNYHRKFALIFALVINLILLGYYKYTNFLITIVNQVTDSAYPLTSIILPLGISFFTFTQISYLVDCYYKRANEYSLVRYILFVTYFPHQIAGPILHHKEMMPQFANIKYAFAQNNISSVELVSAITLFVIGLSKKVIFADSVGKVANMVFDAALNDPIAFVDAWFGVLAYTLQIYFDFSGYCDMAIAISLLFGVRLPINFNSPYQATNIIDFWRRWHMTLSRFLREYVYIPLGGNRKGSLRRYINLFLTMILGGLWHGAGWTFLIWGFLHGFYLSCNHFWCYAADKFNLGKPGYFRCKFSFTVTFLSIMTAWVFFRASSVNAALSLLIAMFNPTTSVPASQKILLFDKLFILLLFYIALYAPNSLQIMGRVHLALDYPTRTFMCWYQWRINIWFAALSGLVSALVLLSVLAIGDGAQFLYFEF